jgi:anti-sigma regulatory factor (Ser/Thr protein kinase)
LPWVTAPDEVRLAVPATPEFLRLVRVTAAGLGSRLGFNYDQVEDLRLAIDELCFSLSGASGRPGTVHVRFLVDDDTLEVVAEGYFEDGRASAPESEWSKVILAALVDSYDLTTGPNGPAFRLTKSRTAKPPAGGA